MNEVAAVAFGYLAGSIPVAYLVARRRGVDLRVAGSGNIGTANVLRTTDVSNAALTLCLDVAKGAVAVLVAQRFSTEPATPVAGGLASIIGHVYPVWLGFRGGKGVATAGGVFAVLTPMAAAVAAAVFALATWVTRYASVGSIAAAVTLAATTAAIDVHGAVVVGAVIAAFIVVHRHRSNLARLLAGTERRVGQRP
jgi:glycerol-3-phosphate acyltransferase PlsY